MPKLHYSKKELIIKGWATVGGRIEDYENTVMADSKEAAYQDIKSTYGNCVDDVYRGLLVYIRYGADAYYDESLIAGSH